MNSSTLVFTKEAYWAFSFHMHTSERLYDEAWGLVFTEMHEDCFTWLKILPSFVLINMLLEIHTFQSAPPLQQKYRKVMQAVTARGNTVFLTQSAVLPPTVCLNSFGFRNQDWSCDKRWSNHFSQMQHLEEHNLMSRHPSEETCRDERLRETNSCQPLPSMLQMWH